MGVKQRKKNRTGFQYRANSRRKQLKMKKKINPHIDCLEIRKAWDITKPAPTNLANMGLAYDLDRAMPLTDKKQQGEKSEVQTIKKGKKEKPTEVVQQLEKASSQESQKERPGVRLTNAQVDYATAMLDKYGDDYKAMARDPKNYFQDTWKQIRTKIKLFTNNPRYYAPYLKQRGLLKPELLQTQDK
ncbi:nucleolar protein 16 [Procambarus clarkii]|uniref:nucleolar protein 16 n=1 Tax=Procambarus clarkii TaxID=6728 RepID=UPI001E6784A1|nr:nucleolar protein 16-like [Procambarus clarkii]XP_045624883.1 nucleolar protein 16-like [Procambarus clarkii]